MKELKNQNGGIISDALTMLAMPQLEDLTNAQIDIGTKLSVAGNDIEITSIYYLDTHNCLMVVASDGATARKISASNLINAINAGRIVRL